ncbi:unnamed protein product [Angiostrongylus costaricensis]|uniref:DUF1116 domain-containing protein n=1 Tax=Angiostrongylus costaricensis TaxID=334426 RepID=A0A0R3PF92_ANGCS|nr:unnamed protein product [Angiostrongylus costaricensis]
MVYSTAANVPAQVAGIANSEAGAQAFVSRLLMQAVIDVLEEQGRSAGLSDAIISTILGQLTVQVRYTPLRCMTVAVNQPANMDIAGVADMMKPHCIIVGNTVTALCNAPNGMMCQLANAMMIANIPATHLSISGSLTTTNVIMANWSREMWQGVVNRAVRMLASGPFGTNFASAFATVV